MSEGRVLAAPRETVRHRSKAVKTSETPPHPHDGRGPILECRDGATDPVDVHECVQIPGGHSD